MLLAQFLPLTDQTGWLHDAGWLLMHPRGGSGFSSSSTMQSRPSSVGGFKASTGPRLIPMLASVGLISYSLYLTHSFVLMHWYWFGFTQLHIRSISLLILTTPSRPLRLALLPPLNAPS